MQRNRATQKHLENGSAEENVDGGLWVQPEEDGDGSSRQSWMELSGLSVADHILDARSGLQVHRGMAPSYLADHCKPTTVSTGRCHLQSATSDSCLSHEQGPHTMIGALLSVVHQCVTVCLQC